MLHLCLNTNIGTIKHIRFLTTFRHDSWLVLTLSPFHAVTILPGVTSKKDRQIIHVESGRVIVERARWCDGFFSKMRGFTFRRKLESGQGLVLVEKSEGRLGSGVTMLFTFLDLGVIWVNSKGEVVDTVHAKPWRLSYTPNAPAQFAVEVDPSLLKIIKIGDHLRFTKLDEHN
jgi:uncharacterized membrane protein (UPF0127 family)